MNENKFEQLLLDRLDKIDNRFDKIDARLDRMDDRMTTIESRIGNLEQTTASIKTKLDARSEFFTDLKSWIAIGVAVAAVIFAWLK